MANRLHSGHQNGNSIDGSAVDSSSLDTLETNMQFSSFESPLQESVFRKIRDERTRILTLLYGSPDEAHRKRASNIRLCGSYSEVVRVAGNEPKLIVKRCKDRMCPRCSRVNAYKCSKALQEIMQKMPSRRLITLTLKHEAGFLSGQIDRLMSSWRELRRSRDWKANVRGGIYSLEVKLNHANKTWHPHLHIIVEGSYFDQKLLANLWERVTGGSRIVDIRAIHDTEVIGNYISKYVTKPSEVVEWEDDVLIEYINAIRGRRLFHTFGSLHNKVKLNAGDKIDYSQDGKYASSQQIVDYAREGIEECQHVIDAMVFMPGKWRATFGVYYEPLLPGFEHAERPSLATIDFLLMRATRAIHLHRHPPPPKVSIDAQLLLDTQYDPQASGAKELICPARPAASVAPSRFV